MNAFEEEPAAFDEVEWTIEEYSVPLLEMPSRLAILDVPVRRACIGLGGARSELELLRRVGSPESAEDLHPDGWALFLGPIATGCDQDYLVGTVAVALGCTGNPFPWTPRELMLRAEKIESIQRIKKLCEETWPAEPIAPSAQAQAARRALGKYWLYDAVDRPLDWTWGFWGVA